MPYKVGIIFRDGRPVTYDSGDYPACQATALEAADYDGFARAPGEARASRAAISASASATRSKRPGSGRTRARRCASPPPARSRVYTGATPQGQSHKTTLAQIAADQFGVDYDDVTVVTGDTAAIALGMGTFAARTAVNAGSSVHLAAIEVAKKLKQLAADMMECVERRPRARATASPTSAALRTKRKSFREIAVKAVGMPGFSMAGGLTPGLEHTAYFTPDQSTYSNGTHVAEVEVDIETGRGRRSCATS